MKLFDWFKKARQSEAIRPAFIRIPNENVSDVSQVTDFESNQHYFEIVVNEMYLSYRRQWLNIFDPTVFVVSEFEYDGSPVEVPFVVGPAQIAQFRQALPAGQGFLYRNTSVAGVHPFKGHSIKLTLILNRIPSESPLRNLINVIERFTGTYSKELKSAVSGYMKIANVALDSIESLTGSDEIKPVMGVQDTFTKPGHFLLVNEEDKEFDHSKFFVTSKGLCYGDRNTEFRSDDYVLFSLRQTSRRQDVEQLPPFKSWKEINSSLSRIQRKLTEEEKSQFRGLLMPIAYDLQFGPDFTAPHADQVFDEYRQKLEKEFSRRDALSGDKSLQGSAQPDPFLDKIQQLHRKVYNNGN